MTREQFEQIRDFFRNLQYSYKRMMQDISKPVQSYDPPRILFNAHR